MLILAGLAVGIYFIVADAIDRKIENCMFKHFHDTGLLEEYKVNWGKDPSKISYTTDECKTYIDLGRKKTSHKIDETAFKLKPECVKQRLKDVFLDVLMMKSVIDKYQIEAPDFKTVVVTNATIVCSQS